MFNRVSLCLVLSPRSVPSLPFCSQTAARGLHGALPVLASAGSITGGTEQWQRHRWHDWHASWRMKQRKLYGCLGLLNCLTTPHLANSLCLIKTSTQLGYSCRKEREKQLSEFEEQLQARRLVCHTLASAHGLSSCCSFTLLYICPTLQSTSLSALIASIFTSREGIPQSFCASEWRFCVRHHGPKQPCFTHRIVWDTELNHHK